MIPLFATLAPFQQAAGAPGPGRWHSMRVFLSPIRVHVVEHDAAGHELRVFEAAGDPNLAEATTNFINAGLDQLPERIRRPLCKVITGGGAELVLLVDLDAGHAAVALVPHGQGADPIVLAVQAYPEIRH